MAWKTLHPAGYVADRPYDTGKLTDLRNRSMEAGTNFGRAVSLPIGGKYGDVQDYTGTRPFTSVTGYACIAAIPWWVPRHLKQLKCDLWLRVSNAELDDTNGESGELLPVEVNVRFLQNFNVGGATIYPLIDAGNGAVWQRIAIDYDIGDWRDQLGDFWDYLVIEFRSSIASNLGTSDTSGTVDKSQIGNRKSYRVLADDAGFYSNLSAPAPKPYAPETMATIASVQGITTPYDVLGVWDHVLSADGGDSMVVWPPSDLLVTDAQWVWLAVASYLQLGSVQIQEVFDDELTNVQANEILSLQPAYFSVPFALAADVNDVLARPELACAVSQGWPAEGSDADAGALWDARGYLKRCRSTHGDFGSPRYLIRQGAASRLPVDAFVLRAQLAGVFAAGNYYEDESYSDTADKSVVGYVTVRATILQWVDGVESVVADSGDVIRKMRFVIANKLSQSHWLYNAAWLNKYAGTEPEGFCYSEGLLRLNGPRSAVAAEYVRGPLQVGDDTAVLTDKDGAIVLEFAPTDDFDYRRPYTVRLAVEVTDGPGGEKGEFLNIEVGSTLRKETGNQPLREAMQVFCISQGLFTRAAPPIAGGDFKLRGQIRARDLRSILDTQDRAREVWGRRVVVDFDDDPIELDSATETQANESGGRGLDRFDFEFRPVRAEIRAAAASAVDKTNFLVEMVAHVVGGGSPVTVIAKFYALVEGDVASNLADFELSAAGSDEWIHVARMVELDSSPPGEVQSYRVRIFAIGEGGVTFDYLEIGEPDTIGPADVGAHRLGADTYIAPLADGGAITVWRGFEADHQLGGSADMVRDEFAPRVNAAAFDGAADYLTASITPGSSVIYAAAFNSDVSDAMQRHILHSRVGSFVNTACRIYVQSGGLYVETEQGGVLSSSLVRSAAAATWYDVVVALANGVRRVWVDGVLELDESPGAMPLGTGTCYVGRGAGGGYFDGRIALVDVIEGWDDRDVERYIMRRRQLLGSY